MKPIETLAMPEGLIYNKPYGAFTQEREIPSDTVDVVLPVFQCTPDFRSQDHGVCIQEWILASDATFRFAPMPAAKLESKLLPHAGPTTVSRESTISNASTQPPSDEEESRASPRNDKLLYKDEVFHPSSINSNCVPAAFNWRMGCLTAGSSPFVPLIPGDENRLAVTKRAVPDICG